MDEGRKMFRRLSKIIKPEKGTEEDKKLATNGVNGDVQTNGKTQKRRTSAIPFRSKDDPAAKYPDPPDHSNSRLDIEGSMKALLGVVDHSLRPTPKDTGDGTYLKQDAHPSIWKELKTIGFKVYLTSKQASS